MSNWVENVGGYRRGTVSLGVPFLFLLSLILYGLFIALSVNVVSQGGGKEYLIALVGVSMVYASWWVCAQVEKGKLVPGWFIGTLLDTFPLTMTILYACVIALVVATSVLVQAGGSVGALLWLVGGLMIVVKMCEAALFRERMSIAENERANGG